MAGHPEVRPPPGADWKATRFLEGNRGLRQPARDDYAAVGTAGRAAGSPASPRQARFDLCLRARAGYVARQPSEGGGRPRPARIARVAVSPGPLPAPPSLVALAASPIPLVGREAELRSLEEAWSLAREGCQQLVLLAGEPGIGKSRLAMEFARSAARRSTVLVGRCDREALVPFAPFVTMLQWSSG